MKLSICVVFFTLFGTLIVLSAQAAENNVLEDSMQSIMAREVVTSSDPRYYGAKCDWNGKTGTDDTAAIQKAINTIGQGQLVFPANKWCKVSSSLLLLAPANPGMHIQGAPNLADTQTSGIVADPAASSPFIPLVIAAKGVTVDGLVINGVSSTTGKASAGILCWFCGRGKFHQTTVTNIAGDGYLISDSYFIATSTTAIPGAGLVTLKLTGVPFPLFVDGTIATLEPGGANQETPSIRVVGPFSSGTQTITVRAAKTHAAPFKVALAGNNNGIIFDHTFARHNAGWGYNVASDYGLDGQNDLQFHRAYATYNASGGLLVDGPYESGEISGGTYDSNGGYPIQFGTPTGLAPHGWRIFGPDDLEENANNCIYEARARQNTYLSGSYNYLCPPTATRTIANPIASSSVNVSSNGLHLGTTPKGDYLLLNMNENATRGIALWPYNFNTLVQPSLSGPTITGGAVNNDVRVVSGGANWLRNPVCTVSGDGSGAKCTAVADVTASLTVTSVTITSRGSGYSTASVSLSGGQDMALSLHSRGQQPIRLNMAVTGHTFTGSTGGVIFGDGVNAAYPVARVDNLGCISYSESSSEGNYGKLCQTFTGKNTYTFPNASGMHTWTISALESSNTYGAGQKQTMQASSTTAGFSLAGVSADPTKPVEGDVWYRSDLHRLRYREQEQPFVDCLGRRERLWPFNVLSHCGQLLPGTDTHHIRRS